MIYYTDNMKHPAKSGFRLRLNKRRPKKRSTRCGQHRWRRPSLLVWYKWMWRVPAILVGLSIWGVVIFRFIPPILTPLMLIRSIQGHLSHKPIGIKVRWRSLNNISPHLIRAVIASEDQRFFEHNGFDWEQIDKALAKSRSARGRTSPTGGRFISTNITRY